MVINDLRDKYPVFIFRNYSVKKNKDEITLVFDFTIEGLTDFSPNIKINTRNLKLLNLYDSPCAKRIVFALGLVEAVSYFKAVCPKTVKVPCGFLSSDEKLWFKKLWYNGLGEFFYNNNIELGFDEFVSIEAFEDEKIPQDDFVGSAVNLIPIGGGKDSCVTSSLLEEQKNLFITVNDQQARTQCVRAAGYGENSIIKTHREIDKRLIELNRQGFLNGHTPFSAIVAFLSLYCAYITGCESIVLSNESSANEGNIKEGSVNHQYSKSFTFEKDFYEYVNKYITKDIKYFSLLRPFNELQIAKYFAGEKQYHMVFRSCNRGSKENIWCCSCPKCLFVFGVLSPFLSEDEMLEIFPKNLFKNENLLITFKGLIGHLPVKPFECVGTTREYLFAVSKKTEQLKSSGKQLPFLLGYLDRTEKTEEIVKHGTRILDEFNMEHLVPDKFLFALERMKRIVSAGN